MRQINTFVRLKGNRGTGMAVSGLLALNWTWYKTVQAVPVSPAQPAIAFPRVRYGFGPRAVAPRGRGGESHEIRLKGR